MANFNVIEIKRLIMLSFALVIKINVKKIKQNNILTKIEIISLCKRVVRLFSSELCSEVSDFLPVHHRDHLINIEPF